MKNVKLSNSTDDVDKQPENSVYYGLDTDTNQVRIDDGHPVARSC